ncbi:hypothetical protein H4R33_006705 [Dimargaris cristalligena]|uniref:t-SNARE n=1 Tax=Dimargaris cristalligena TaxID=215637 RepID=A0A4P9ZTN6_9FUNG|nr:hypothetical protein H4R33_006705 [Dimargaris cristalligena]RKP35900.1 t-SNARE [Dimargaris cristalligena]|eukprot:RKP35900.1 t-SNARE [Dimargaris cristalligena]
MSFNDLHSGGARPVGQTSLSADDANYRKVLQKISQNVFRVNSYVATIQRLVEQLTRNSDTTRTRQQLHDVTEKTRELAKATGTDIKGLDSFQKADPTVAHTRKIEQQKLSKDFQKVLEQFQVAQREAAEKSREYVDRAKHAVEQDNAAAFDESDEQASLLQHDQRRHQLQVVDNEVEFNEALIAERESEIREIEQGITELNEVFRDLGTIVNEQQSLLDNIESNVTSIAINVRNAGEELITASRYQRKSRKTMCFLLLLLVVIVSIVLLVALS